MNQSRGNNDDKDHNQTKKSPAACTAPLTLKETHTHSHRHMEIAKIQIKIKIKNDKHYSYSDCVSHHDQHKLLFNWWTKTSNSGHFLKVMGYLMILRCKFIDVTHAKHRQWNWGCEVTRQLVSKTSPLALRIKLFFFYFMQSCMKIFFVTKCIYRTSP